MKKVFFSLLLLTATLIVSAQVSFDKLSFSPQFPQALQKISFEYNPAQSAIAGEKNIEAVVYIFNNNGFKIQEPVLEKTGEHYTASITIDSNANCLAFVFNGGKEKDNNFGKGFIVPVYNQQKQPVQDYYTSAAQLNSGFGEYLFGMKSDAEKGLAMVEEGMKLYPDAADKYRSTYFAMLNGAKKKDAVPLIKEKLKAIESKQPLKEADYGVLIEWYSRLKQQSTVDSLTTLMKQQYPAGSWKKRAMIDAMFTEKNPEKAKQRISDYVKAYPPNASELATIENVKSQIANIYGTAKNYAALKEIAKELSPAARYGIYNNFAWEMAESNENIEEATLLAKEATLWTKNEAENPTEKKPETLTKKGWEAMRKNNYSMYADTYAFILYNTGAYKEGLPFAKDAATIANLNDAELNERYAMLLAKATPGKDAQKVIEQMVSEGKATEKTKDALKEIYVKENKSETGYEAYVANLEKAANEKKKEDIAKSMISEPAPAFKLKDFEGKEVSLESLKGKVVVVDFWATWCGPCIASMPGMKKAEEKLKPRGDVVFLFIDTWENVEDKKKNAMDFMKKKNYPFYVLLDNENKTVGDFGVKGIPAKFIIDKKGNIRFKATGFGGNADELIEELTVMVDLASK